MSQCSTKLDDSGKVWLPVSLKGEEGRPVIIREGLSLDREGESHMLGALLQVLSLGEEKM